MSLQTVGSVLCHSESTVIS